MIVRNRLRCGFAQFKLRAHLLQARSKRVNLLLLLRCIGFHFLNFAVLFQKLIEQHRVHRFIANGVWLALLVASH